MMSRPVQNSRKKVFIVFTGWDRVCTHFKDDFVKDSVLMKLDYTFK